MSKLKINDLNFDRTLDANALAAVAGGWGLVGKIGSWVAKRSKRVYGRLRKGQYYLAYKTLLAPFGNGVSVRKRRDFRK